jgi:hypothetical protein
VVQVGWDGDAGTAAMSLSRTSEAKAFSLRRFSMRGTPSRQATILSTLTTDSLIPMTAPSSGKRMAHPSVQLTHQSRSCVATLHGLSRANEEALAEQHQVVEIGLPAVPPMQEVVS